MIKPDQVPDNVLNVAVETYYRNLADAGSEGLADSFRLAIAAALNAWPRMKEDSSWDLRTHERRCAIILPLGDDK